MTGRTKPKWMFTILILGILITSCTETNQQKLPYIGFHQINGRDTAYHKISNFSMLNQDSIQINNDVLSSNIYVVDFFYSYCPFTCPNVRNQMLRIYDSFQNDNRLKLVSFALDPEHDDVEKLHAFSKNLGIDSKKWYFLTGDQEKIWDLAAEYLISVQEDSDEPGGIYHSGKIILIDRKGHIRGFADGTIEQEVTDLMDDIELLLHETEQMR